MLLRIREKSKGIFAYLLVGLIAIAFSLWGVDSLFTAMHGDPNEIAKVNSSSISQVSVDRLAQRQFQQLLANEQVNPEQIDLDMLRQFALNSLIQEELLSQLAQKNNMTIADRQVERQLVRMQVFQDEQGRFAQENFTQILRQEGISPFEFRQQLKQDLLNQQLLGSLQQSEFVLTKELEDFQVLAGQERSYSYKVFSAQDFMDQVTPTVEEIDDFYQRNSMSFQQAEQLKVDYTLFDPSSLLAGLEPSAEELEAEYANYVKQLESQAKNYSAAHLMLEFSNAKEKQAAQEKLEALRAEILAGASFAELAKKHSQDISTANLGGELGAILPGSFDANFEAALYQLENTGDVSQPVETNYGFHLIQLTAKEEAEIPSLQEVESQLKEQLVAQPWKEAVEAKLEELTNLSFSSSDLAELAQATGLEVNTSPWLNKTALADFWQEAAVSQAIFSKDLIQDNWLTEPLPLANGSYLIAQRNAYQEPRQLELEEVKQEVIQALSLELAAKLAKAAANDELAKITSNASNEETFKDWEVVKQVGRNTNQVASLINNQAFKLSLNQPLQLVNLTSQEVALIKLIEVNPGKPVTEAEQQQLTLGLTSDQANRMQQKFMTSLQEQAKIILR